MMHPSGEPALKSLEMQLNCFQKFQKIIVKLLPPLILKKYIDFYSSCPNSFSPTPSLIVFISFSLITKCVAQTNLFCNVQSILDGFLELYLCVYQPYNLSICIRVVNSWLCMWVSVGVCGWACVGVCVWVCASIYIFRLIKYF